jgi:hypothetical protein
MAQKRRTSFMDVPKDNDCRITFAQMKKLFATLYLKKGHHSSFSALRHFWAIKIDFMTFLDFLEKCQILYLLDKLNDGSDDELDEETKKQLFQGSDKIWFRLLFYKTKKYFLMISKMHNFRNY